MSTSVGGNVARVARIIGLVSKPELNGKFVTLGRFNEETQRYSVRTLPDPNNDTGNNSLPPIAVKKINLELVAPSFGELYPTASVMKGLHPDYALPGTIFDISARHFTTDDPIVFDKACSIRGAHFILSSGGRPTTRITTPIYFALQNSSDVVEFEDINFDIQKEGIHSISCTGGKKITFRRCRFSSLDAGCGATGHGTEVVFENCFFEDLVGSGVIVECGAKVTLLNCHICRTSSGIEIRNGGTAHLTHCTIIDTKLPGVAVYANGQSVTMEMCTILRSKDSGVIVTNGGEMFMKDCRIENCGVAGAAIEGPSRSKAHISNSVFTGCQLGVLVQTGKSDVIIEQSKMFKNLVCGLFVGEDAIGEIVVNECAISENRFRDINNDGGPYSSLLCDGCIVPKDGLMSSLSRSNPAQANKIVRQAQCAVDSILGGRLIGCNGALENARVRKLAGVGSVYCAACGKEEPPKKKFNKCSKCLDKCYCTKECQVISSYFYE